jgi:hypothetical protein
MSALWRRLVHVSATAHTSAAVPLLPCRGLVGAFNSLFAELQDQADIRGVYITEAHAQDEWPITSARYTPDRKPVILNQVHLQTLQISRDSLEVPFVVCLLCGRLG